MKNVMIALSAAALLSAGLFSCSKSETLEGTTQEKVVQKRGNSSSSSGKNLHKMAADADMILYHQAQIELVNQVENMAYVREFSSINSSEVTQNDLNSLSGALGFSNYDAFEAFFNSNLDRLNTLNEKYNIESMKQEQLETVMTLIHNNTGGIGVGVGNDDFEPIAPCEAAYNSCIAQAIAQGALLGAGCVATGFFVVPCVALVAVNQTAEIYDCEQEYQKCIKGE